MSRVYIDVGGVFFETSLKTMEKSPLLLRAYEEDAENVFIDRDPSLFPYVLNFLRNGILVTPHDKHLLQLIELEGDFFELPELVESAASSASRLEDCTLEGTMSELKAAITDLREYIAGERMSVSGRRLVRKNVT